MMWQWARQIGVDKRGLRKWQNCPGIGILCGIAGKKQDIIDLKQSLLSGVNKPFGIVAEIGRSQNHRSDRNFGSDYKGFHPGIGSLQIP